MPEILKNQPRKFQKGAPQLVSRRTRNGFSMSLRKPESDKIAQLIEYYRQAFIRAVEDGDVEAAKCLLPQIRTAFLKQFEHPQECREINFTNELRTEEGICAIILASANRDPHMVRFLRKNLFGVTSKSDPMLQRLSIRPSK